VTNDPESSDKRPYRDLYMLTTVGVQLVVSILIGLGIGLWLDGLMGTAPWMMILFIVFGLVAGFRNIYRQATQSVENEDTKR
jgi:ATP synthase protein I